MSSSEIRRLRERDAALAALRDSLRDVVETSAAGNAEMMTAAIHFAFDKSQLTDSAKTILDEKVAMARANPNMSIVMVGYTDLLGTDAYNMALGTRRAVAAKVYIVDQGIASSRVTIESKGERRPVTEAPGIAAQAPNRRAVFRLVVAPDVKSGN